MTDSPRERQPEVDLGRGLQFPVRPGSSDPHRSLMGEHVDGSQEAAAIISAAAQHAADLLARAERELAIVRDLRAIVESELADARQRARDQVRAPRYAPAGGAEGPEPDTDGAPDDPADAHTGRRWELADDTMSAEHVLRDDWTAESSYDAGNRQLAAARRFVREQSELAAEVLATARAQAAQVRAAAAKDREAAEENRRAAAALRADAQRVLSSAGELAHHDRRVTVPRFSAAEQARAGDSEPASIDRQESEESQQETAATAEDPADGYALVNGTEHVPMDAGLPNPAQDRRDPKVD